MNTQQIIEQIAEAMSHELYSANVPDYVHGATEALTAVAPFIPQWVDVKKPPKKHGIYNVKYPSAYPDRFTTLPAKWDGENWLFHFDKKIAIITEHVKEYQPLPSTTHPYEQLLQNLKNNNDGK